MNHPNEALVQQIVSGLRKYKWPRAYEDCQVTLAKAETVIREALAQQSPVAKESLTDAKGVTVPEGWELGRADDGPQIHLTEKSSQCGVWICHDGKSDERMVWKFLDAMLTATPAAAEVVPDADEETYQMGKRDGYEEAVQNIDLKTGGDGEYRYCMDGDPDRHTPDAPAMIERIVERFDRLRAQSEAARVPVMGEAVAYQCRYPKDAEPEWEFIHKIDYDDWIAIGNPRRELRALYLAPTASITQEELDVLRKKASEADRLDALINNPHTENFLSAVQLEAAHQQERWGSDHDAGKEDADWFWLIGYLAGKAIRPGQPQEKRLHHIITTAAACLNWHARASGAHAGRSMAVRQPTMRPGLSEEAQASIDGDRAIQDGK